MGLGKIGIAVRAILEQLGIASDGAYTAPAANVTDTSSGAQVTRGTADTFGELMLSRTLRLGHDGYVGPFQSLSNGGEGMFSVGTRTADTVTLGGDATNGIYAAIRTSTVQDNTTSWVQGTPFVRVDSKPYAVFRFALGDVEDVRFFAGWSNTGTAATPVSADDPAACRVAGLTFSTARPDTNFMWMEHDDTTQTLTDTGVAPAVGTVYSLEIDLSSRTSFTMRLRDSSWAVLSTRTVTTEPFDADAVTLSWVHALRNLGSTDAKELRWYVLTGALRTGTP